MNRIETEALKASGVDESTWNDPRGSMRYWKQGFLAGARWMREELCDLALEMTDPRYVNETLQEMRQFGEEER